MRRNAIYRSLDLLERQGLLTRMHLDSCHGYAVCDGDHHHHLACTVCGTVLPVDASAIEAEIRKLAERARFRVDSHTLESAGRCESCLDR